MKKSDYLECGLMDLAVKKKGVAYTISISGKETDYFLMIDNKTEEGEWCLFHLGDEPQENVAELFAGLKAIQKQFIEGEGLDDFLERVIHKKTGLSKA